MQIKGNIGAIHFVAPLVRACEILFDLDCQSSIFFPVLQLVELEILVLESLLGDMDTYKDSTSV